MSALSAEMVEGTLPLKRFSESDLRRNGCRTNPYLASDRGGGVQHDEAGQHRDARREGPGEHVRVQGPSRPTANAKASFQAKHALEAKHALRSRAHAFEKGRVCKYMLPRMRKCINMEESMPIAEHGLAQAELGKARTIL